MPRNGFFFEQNFNCVLVDWTVFASNVTCQMPCSYIGRKKRVPNSMLISCLSTRTKAERSPGSQLTGLERCWRHDFFFANVYSRSVSSHKWFWQFIMLLSIWGQFVMYSECLLEGINNWQNVYFQNVDFKLMSTSEMSKCKNGYFQMEMTTSHWSPE